jgi:hypothetical protein
VNCPLTWISHSPAVVECGVARRPLMPTAAREVAMGGESVQRFFVPVKKTRTRNLLSCQNSQMSVIEGTRSKVTALPGAQITGCAAEERSMRLKTRQMNPGRYALVV